MTDDIKLPELPYPYNTLQYRTTGKAIEEYVRAAVLADRERRQAEVDALRTDKARLDFMDQVAKGHGYDGFRLDCDGDYEVLPGFLFHYRQRKENVGIRAVVDAARAAGDQP